MGSNSVRRRGIFHVAIVVQIFLFLLTFWCRLQHCPEEYGSEGHRSKWLSHSGTPGVWVGANDRRRGGVGRANADALASAIRCAMAAKGIVTGRACRVDSRSALKHLAEQALWRRSWRAVMTNGVAKHVGP